MSKVTHCIAIDPGPEKSALVVFDGVRIDMMTDSNNEDILNILRTWRMGPQIVPLVIEQIASYGMAVGAEVFETCVWTGRFMEAYGEPYTHRITRNKVKNHICHSSKANDSNIRQAIIDLFGGKEKAIGKKAAKGPLFGVSGDLWAALAVALTFCDQQQQPGINADAFARLAAGGTR